MTNQDRDTTETHISCTGQVKLPHGMLIIKDPPTGDNKVTVLTVPPVMRCLVLAQDLEAQMKTYGLHL